MPDLESSSGSDDTSYHWEYSDIEWDPGDIDSDGEALVTAKGETMIPMEEQAFYEEDEAQALQAFAVGYRETRRGLRRQATGRKFYKERKPKSDSKVKTTRQKRQREWQAPKR